MDSELPHGLIEQEFRATALELYTPAHSDTLALLIPDRQNPNAYHYRRISVQSAEQPSRVGTAKFAVHVREYDLGENVVIEGYLESVIKNLVAYEEMMRQSPDPAEHQYFAAVGVVGYSGHGIATLPMLAQFAGIYYHQERQNFLLNSPFQA